MICFRRYIVSSTSLPLVRRFWFVKNARYFAKRTPGAHLYRVTFRGWGWHELSTF